ncbi:MAG TPA: hypothetical protein VGN12_05595 [Pirellulales bacterium]|jgi:hypothetical protein
MDDAIAAKVVQEQAVHQSVQAPPLPTEVVLAVLSIILIVALGLVVFYFSLRTIRESVRYNIVLQLMALIITAFVAFLAVATGSLEQVASLGGKIGLITFSFAGAPAIFFASLFLCKWISRDLSFADEHFIGILQARDTARLIQFAEKRLGWIDYEEWKQTIGAGSRQAIESDETYFIDDLLPKVYYHGDRRHIRPARPEISTLVVYTTSGPIKIQRIRGEYIGGVARPRLHMQSTSSTDAGSIKNIHFFARNGTITTSGTHEHGAWVDTHEDSIDCLVCTIYDGDVPSDGDYLYVDPGKYLPVDEAGDAVVEVAVLIAAQQEKLIAMRGPSLWHLRASANSNLPPVPFIFFRASEKPLVDGAAQKAMNATFGPWLQLLEEYRNDPATSVHARTFLDQCSQRLGPAGNLTSLFAATSRGWFYASRHVTDVVIAVFEWGRV